MNKLKRFMAASMASLMALASAAVSIPAATEDPVINTIRQVDTILLTIIISMAAAIIKPRKKEENV